MNAHVLNRKMSVWKAGRKGDLDGVKAAVENGADIEERGGLWGGTALHYASTGGYFSITDYLIQRGAEVNCKDNTGSLPIHYACGEGHLDTVELLIRKGSDFTSTDIFGNTPLDHASMNGHTRVTEYLTQRAAEAGN